jgi:hypothetical protein
MTRTLIAVISCYADASRGSHQAIRETWGQDVAPADIQFFIPEVNDYAPLPDEVLLDVPGDYNHISDEVREILRWSLAAGYDYTFLCCNDLFCIPRLLLDSGFEKYDYSGVFYPSYAVIGTRFIFDWNKTLLLVHPWTNLGLGSFVSRKAAELIVPVEFSKWHSAADIHIGQVLGPLIQKGEVLAKNLELEKGVCWHYRDISGKTYDPTTGWMKKMYKMYGAHK